MLQALRAAVGKGHMADRDGVEWRWREARAIGLALISTMTERALAQFEPAYASDALEFYRDLFSLPADLEQGELRSRAELLAHNDSGLDVPSVGAELQQIDPRFSILERPWSLSGTAIPGRAFEDWAQTLPFRVSGLLDRGETRYPMFSDAFELIVKFDTGGVAPTGEVERVALAAARDYLDDDIPSWCTYTILGGTGFTLDESLLDWTGLGI